MNRREVFEWVYQMYGTKPLYPYDHWTAVLCHADSKKWYAVIVEVELEQLGLNGQAVIDVLNVECTPSLMNNLLQEKKVYIRSAVLKNKIGLVFGWRESAINPKLSQTPLISGMSVPDHENLGFNFLQQSKYPRKSGVVI